MIETFKSIKRLRKQESYKKWIIKILINKCNHIYKKNKEINNDKPYMIELEKIK